MRMIQHAAAAATPGHPPVSNYRSRDRRTANGGRIGRIVEIVGILLQLGHSMRVHTGMVLMVVLLW